MVKNEEKIELISGCWEANIYPLFWKTDLFLVENGLE